MEKLLTTGRDAEGKIYHKEVDAERAMIMGVECFIFNGVQDVKGRLLDYHISINYCAIYHLETGMRISCEFKKQSAIDMAISNLEKYPHYVEEVRKYCDMIGVNLPVNK
jgi:hypothetical protein